MTSARSVSFIDQQAVAAAHQFNPAMNRPTAHAASRRRVEKHNQACLNREGRHWVTPWPMSIRGGAGTPVSGETPQRRFPPLLMTVGALFLAAAAPVGDTRAGAHFRGADHIPVGADIQEAARAGTHIPEAARAGTHIREAAHIRGAVGSKAHSANTCDRMDQDGNLADTARARTRSA